VYKDEDNYLKILDLYRNAVDRTANMKSFIARLTPPTEKLRSNITSKSLCSYESGWTCELCTYHHSVEQQLYLSCEMCSSLRTAGSNEFEIEELKEDPLERTLKRKHSQC